MTSKRFATIVQRSRYFCTSCAVWKTVPKNLKGKSKSSQDWLTRQLNDPYVKLAKQHQYRWVLALFLSCFLPQSTHLPMPSPASPPWSLANIIIVAISIYSVHCFRWILKLFVLMYLVSLKTSPSQENIYSCEVNLRHIEYNGKVMQYPSLPGYTVFHWIQW